jgi:superfamily II RNA helicase
MKAQSRYLFYLQLGPSLPEFYFRLGEILKAWGIQLLPLKTSDFQRLENAERSDVVCFVPDIGSYRSLLKFKRQFLSYYLNLKQVRLYEVSSFRSSDVDYRHIKTGHYQHFSMPIAIESFAHKVIDDDNESYQINKKWPGGRHSRLPAV